MTRTVLVVAAHPDDEVAGAGGAIAHHAATGDEVHVLYVTDGQRGSDDPDLVSRRRGNAHDCCDVLGVSELHFAGLTDTELDQTPHREINSVIEDRIRDLEPAVVYTHARDELHLDHRAVHESTVVATRPPSGVDTVLGYEVPSSTNRTTTAGFRPSVFVDITDYVDRKIEALLQYSGETDTAPHPRSEAVLRGQARFRGTAGGYESAEAFSTIAAYCDSVERIP